MKTLGPRWRSRLWSRAVIENKLMKSSTGNRLRYHFLAVVLCMAMGCKTTAPTTYLQNDPNALAGSRVSIPEPVIQKGDVLGITVFSDNPAATGIYNQASGGSSGASAGGAPGGGASASPGGSGYLVDQDGNIRMHAIGVLHVEGLTKKQLSDLVLTKLAALESLSNPYCVIRFLNFRITVLGDVGNQGIFTVPNEKATIFDGLGLAGGITDFGRKDNVMVVREKDGNRSYHYLDMTKGDIVKSPVFYLQQNDVIIVNPDPRKQTATTIENQRRINLSLALLSAVTIIVTLATSVFR